MAPPRTHPLRATEAAPPVAGVEDGAGAPEAAGAVTAGAVGAPVTRGVELATREEDLEGDFLGVKTGVEVEDGVTVEVEEWVGVTVEVGVGVGVGVGVLV